MSAISQPAGNNCDKYRTANPIARRLMRGFLDSFDALAAQVPVASSLEIGCGEGELSIRLAQRGFRALGCDISAEIVEEARRRAAAANVAATFWTQPIETIDETNAAPLVVCCEVLEHLDDPANGVDTLANLARPYHLAARREGVTHAALGAALGLEAALLLAAAAVLALGVAADPRLDALVPWARRSVAFVPVLAVLAWIALSYVAPRFGVPRAPMLRRAPGLALVLGIDLVFFLLAGTALRTLHPQPDALPFDVWCGWLSLAWIVGYVTPGAPAGIGLREAVLALGLSPALGESGALALALLYRLVTTIADGVIAALGFLDRETV